MRTFHGRREVLKEQKWTQSTSLRDARDNRERVRNATIKEDVLGARGEIGLDPQPGFLLFQMTRTW